MLAYGGAKVQTCFYPGDLVTCTGDWEIRCVSGRLGSYVNGRILFSTGCGLDLILSYSCYYNINNNNNKNNKITIIS